MGKLLNSRFFIPILAILLIGVGLFFLTRFTRSSLESYRSMQFAAENNFDAGNLDVDLVQPWMNLRYVAVAYAIPQSYLFEQLDIPMSRQSRRLPVGRLDRRLRREDGEDDQSGVEKVKTAIRAYRENPVASGLDEGRVQRWMNIRYIANSTGIPAEVFFEAAAIPLEGNDHKPMRRLVESTEYGPGEEGLMRILQDVVEEHEERERDSGKRRKGQDDRDSDRDPDSREDGESKP